MRRGRYGLVGKHNDLYEQFISWRDDDEAQEALAEELGWELNEGTGAPEGRADFPLYLLTTIRHRMRRGFTRRAAQWQRYVGRERAEDFRQHTVSQLNGLSGMGPVEEYGEYNRIRSSEQMGPPYSVGKHGGVYGVTFEMVVNDDSNLILNRTPTELGRMNAAYIARVVIALIEGNANYIDGLPFFTATPRQGLPNGNEVTGAAAEPTSDNLADLLSAMRNAEDEEGFPRDINPRWILTREERTRLTFKTILRSQQTGVAEAPTSATSIEKGTLNPLYDDDLLPADSVILEPYLRDPNDWIVLADAERPAFIIAFLRDMTEPMIGIEDSGIRDTGGNTRDPYSLDYDEIKFKLRMIFGVAQGEPSSAFRARRA